MKYFCLWSIGIVTALRVTYLGRPFALLFPWASQFRRAPLPLINMGASNICRTASHTYLRGCPQMTSAFSDTPWWLCQPFVIFYSFSLSLVVQWWDVICGQSLNPTKWRVDNVSRLLGEGARRVRCEVVRPVVPACRANTVLFSTFSTKISTRILPHLSSWVNSLIKLYMDVG